MRLQCLNVIGVLLKFLVFLLQSPHYSSHSLKKLNSNFSLQNLQAKIRIASCYSRIRFRKSGTFVRNIRTEKSRNVFAELRNTFGNASEMGGIFSEKFYLQKRLHTSSNIQHNNLHMRSHRYMKSFI